MPRSVEVRVALGVSRVYVVWPGITTEELAALVVDSGLLDRVYEFLVPGTGSVLSGVIGETHEPLLLIARPPYMARIRVETIPARVTIPQFGVCFGENFHNMWWVLRAAYGALVTYPLLNACVMERGISLVEWSVAIPRGTYGVLLQEDRSVTVECTGVLDRVLRANSDELSFETFAATVAAGTGDLRELTFVDRQTGAPLHGKLRDALRKMPGNPRRLRVGTVYWAVCARSPLGA